MITVEGFDLIESIGQGGLGDVYLATRQSTGGKVALKWLRDVDDQEAVWRRTQRELAALLDLKGHPNVIHVEEVVTTAHGPVIVMEHAGGGSLASLLQRRRASMTPEECIFVAVQASAALAAAHQLGIVHRDVKPQNLLISAFGQVKVCDFGIASLARTAQHRERTSALSYRYASPEELDDVADEIGDRADVYSLGATLHHLRTNEVPQFRNRSSRASPSFGSVMAGSVEDQLIELIRLSTEHRVQDRPTSKELVVAFENISDGLGDRRVRELRPHHATRSSASDTGDGPNTSLPVQPKPSPDKRARSASAALPDVTTAPTEWWAKK